MRLATNHIGFVIQRLDGPIGWQAITEPSTRDEAEARLRDMERTPGAEYRIAAALEGRV